jgi:hypothetical protein
MNGQAGEGSPKPPVDESVSYAIAEDIDRGRPWWLVLYGCYSRQFVAFPLFAMRRRVIVVATYPDALIGRMDDAERLWRIPSEQEE